jgi:hypothetical protein
LSKGVGKFIKKPIKNKTAKKWVEKQQILRKSGIKEIEVPSPDRKLVKKNKTDSMSGYKQIKEFINKPKMKKALYTLVNKNLIPKAYTQNVRKLQLFLTQNPMVMTQLLRLLGENTAKEWKKMLDSYSKSVVYSLSENEENARELKEQKITKVVGIYGGRFQPFGPHHKKVYEWMKKQFDDEDQMVEICLKHKVTYDFCYLLFFQFAGIFLIFTKRIYNTFTIRVKHFFPFLSCIFTK